MSHSDLKAKDALSNFSAAVSNAQSMLQQDLRFRRSEETQESDSGSAVGEIRREWSCVLVGSSDLKMYKAIITVFY